MIKGVSGARPPGDAVEPVPTQHDQPETDLGVWLLGLHDQDDPPSDVPPGQDDPIQKLAVRLRGCVAAGCLSGTEPLSALDIAGHVGAHTHNGRLPGWALDGLRLAERRHRDSLGGGSTAGTEVSAVCGECGLWSTRAQFERNGGCCSRRAVDHGNRWPGDPRPPARHYNMAAAVAANPNAVLIDQDSRLLCPRCAGTWTHVNRSFTAARREDGQYSHIEVDCEFGAIGTGEDCTPAPVGSAVGEGRRHRIALEVECESCGGETVLLLTQDKGQTVVEWVIA